MCCAPIPLTQTLSPILADAAAGDVLCVPDGEWLRVRDPDEDPKVDKLAMMGSWSCGFRDVGIRLWAAEHCD